MSNTATHLFILASEMFVVAGCLKLFEGLCPDTDPSIISGIFVTGAVVGIIFCALYNLFGSRAPRP